MKHWIRTLGGAVVLAGVYTVAAIGQQTTGSPPSGQAPRRAAMGDHHSANVPQIVAALGITTGSHVADVGAGDGAYTVPLAKAVGNEGRVYAVDIDDRALIRLRARVEREGLTNVDIIKGDVDDPKLPAGRLDAVLVVHAYHEMTAYAEILPRFREALKADGRLVIVEPILPARRDEPRAAQVRGHQIAPWFVMEEVRAGGFRVTELRDPFSGQGMHEEWLLVARPAGSAVSSVTPERTAAAAGSAVSPVTAAPGPADDHQHDDFSDAELQAPELRVTMKEFIPQFEAGAVAVLDVRGPEMFAEGHLPGARNVPLHDIAAKAAELAALGKPIVTYCSCPAEESSLRAALSLRKRGIANVRALVGGYEQWIAEKRTVAK